MECVLPAGREIRSALLFAAAALRLGAASLDWVRGHRPCLPSPDRHERSSGRDRRRSQDIPLRQRDDAPPNVFDRFRISQRAYEMRIDMVFVERHTAPSVAFLPLAPRARHHEPTHRPRNFRCRRVRDGPIIEEKSINIGAGDRSYGEDFGVFYRRRTPPDPRRLPPREDRELSQSPKP